MTATQTALLLDARDNSEPLLAMVNNLLDLAQLEQGRQRLQLRPENPADLLHEAADAIRRRAEDTQRPWYRRWFSQSVLDRLLKAVQKVDVMVVDGN